MYSPKKAAKPNTEDKTYPDFNAGSTLFFNIIFPINDITSNLLK